MATFKFEKKSVKKLLDHTLQSSKRFPSVDQLTARELWKDEYQANAQDANEDLEEERVDPSKIPPGLWLIQEPDKELYLASNGFPDLPLPKDLPEMEHSKISSKKKKNIVWEFIPADHLSSVCTDERDVVEISVTAKSIAVVQ